MQNIQPKENKNQKSKPKSYKDELDALANSDENIKDSETTPSDGEVKNVE